MTFMTDVIDWLIDFNGISTCRVIFSREVRKSRLLHVYIYIFWVGQSGPGSKVKKKAPPKSPELEPQYEISFSVIPRKPFFRVGLAPQQRIHSAYS